MPFFKGNAGSLFFLGRFSQTFNNVEFGKLKKVFSPIGVADLSRTSALIVVKLFFGDLLLSVFQMRKPMGKLPLRPSNDLL